VEGLGLVTPLESLRAAFRGRSAFLTGHTGFKGSWLALWLARLGARVSGYSLEPPTEPSNFVTSGVEGLLARHIAGDVRDAHSLGAAVKESAPDVIFHFAAQALVRRGYAAPRETFEANVMGTVNLLEAVRELARPCAVVVVTSDKCYDNRAPRRIHAEPDPLGGEDPYSASKAAAEIVTAAYRSSFFPPEALRTHGIQLATVRAGNVIGGGDWADSRIVPDFFRAELSGRRLVLRNPEFVRPWQHVLEPLAGYLNLASRMLAGSVPSFSSAWNFGPRAEDEVSVAELVEMLSRGAPGTSVEPAKAPSGPREEPALRLSNEKARRELGWQPVWKLSEAARRTSAWYRDFAADRGASTRDYCLHDIEAYENEIIHDEHTLQPTREPASVA